jgi:hypothetical protein
MVSRRRAPALNNDQPAPARVADDWGPTPMPSQPAVLDTQAAPKTRKPRPVEIRIVSARIPAPLFQRMNVARRESGATHEMWFIDAFNAVYDELGEVYPTLTGAPGRVPARRRRARRPAEETLAQYPLRLTAEESAAVEARARELQPTSMSDFVTTIVRLRLEQLGLS